MNNLKLARQYNSTEHLFISIIVKRSTNNNTNIELYDLSSSKPVLKTTAGHHCKYTEIFNNLMRETRGIVLKDWSFNSLDDLENRFKEAGHDVEVCTDSTKRQINYDIYF